MEYIKLAELQSTREGLILLLEHFDYTDVQNTVPVKFALLVIELAKRVTDKEEWFPNGKWSTIQAIEQRVNKELDKYVKEWGE